MNFKILTQGACLVIDAEIVSYTQKSSICFLFADIMELFPTVDRFTDFYIRGYHLLEPLFQKTLLTTFSYEYEFIIYSML